MNLPDDYICEGQISIWDYINENKSELFDISKEAKVLSLFDGMACGMLAMIAAGVKAGTYVSYEIDKYATQTSKHNFPMIQQNGDVFKADFKQYRGFDYLIGGSPCTYWSIAQTKNRETVASGMGWELFSQYVRALKEAQPRFFIYENNKSMSAAIRASITDTFGFEPICINSALVSAQSRQRLYWVGIRQADGSYSKADIKQPEDRGILLKDIINNSVCVAQRGRYDENGKIYQHYEPNTDNKTNTLTTVSKDNLVCTPVCLNSKSGRNGIDGLQPSLQDRIYSIDGKSTAVTTAFMPSSAEPYKVMKCGIDTVKNADTGIIAMLDMKGQETIRRVYGINGKAPTLTTCTGGHREPKIFDVAAGETNAPIYEVKDGLITVKGKQYPIKLVDGFYIIRKLTIKECMRLQTVPEWYEFPVSSSQAYKMLGNGWTVEVIAHLIKATLSKQTGCGKQAECEAYPTGCGGTVNPCRFGGPFKWSDFMNEPKGELND